MRGKLRTTPRVTLIDGITPADAGKTIAVILSEKILQDHPRGCGENESASVAVNGI